MEKGLPKNILIVLLLTITIFSIFKYGASLKEKYTLRDALSKLKRQDALLEKEKQDLLENLKKEKELQQKLNEKNSQLKDILKSSRVRLMRSFKEVRETQNAIEQLTLRLSLLKVENKALAERDNKFLQVLEENAGLKARLSSITELKKAIKEVAIAMRQGKKVENQKIKAPQIIIDGNRGFIIKDGKLTYPAKLKIEVIPASPVGGPVPQAGDPTLKKE